MGWFPGPVDVDWGSEFYCYVQLGHGLCVQTLVVQQWIYQVHPGPHGPCIQGAETGTEQKTNAFSGLFHPGLSHLLSYQLVHVFQTLGIVRKALDTRALTGFQTKTFT